MPLQNKLLKILRGKVLLAFQLFWQKEVKVDINQSFKNRVKEIVISGAKSYQDYFIDYDYLLCSDAFNTNKYYIISGEEDNFKHLTGVIFESGSPKDFFEKSLGGTLEEDDFEIKKDDLDTNTKGSIRRKISVLENAMHIFDSTTFVEEDFEKNNIKCSFATENGSSTIGFTPTGVITRPKTLLKGNQLDTNKSKELELVLRKKRGEKLFTDIIIGNKDVLNKYKQNISELVIDELLK